MEVLFQDPANAGMDFREQFLRPPSLVAILAFRISASSQSETFLGHPSSTSTPSPPSPSKTLKSTTSSNNNNGGVIKTNVPNLGLEKEMQMVRPVHSHTQQVVVQLRNNGGCADKNKRHSEYLEKELLVGGPNDGNNYVWKRRGEMLCHSC